jgi:hypothetical protein
MILLIVNGFLMMTYQNMKRKELRSNASEIIIDKKNG